VLIKPLNAAGEWFYRFLQLPTLDNFYTSVQTDYKASEEFTKPLKVGDKILGFEVTSAYGQRVAPIEGASTKHEGVDIATPEGTPLYVIGKPKSGSAFGGIADVFCTVPSAEDARGQAAFVKSVDFPDIEFVYYHLKVCSGGRLDPGMKFGETGNTGNTDGPHLHFGVRIKGDWLKADFKEEYIEPMTGFVRWTLEGKEPQKQSEVIAVSSDIKPLLDTIRFAEGTDKEDGYQTMFSGAKFTDFSKHPDIVNTTVFNGKPLRSAAAGAYQFMPKTWERVSKGINAIDFSPANQDRGAIFLIKERGAYNLAKQGDIKKTFFELCEEWASLPCYEGDKKGAYNQAVKPIEDLMTVYKNKSSKK